MKIKKTITAALAVCILALVGGLYVDFIKYPEMYLTTEKHALECAIERGDADAIEYYNRVYVAHGKELF